MFPFLNRSNLLFIYWKHVDIAFHCGIFRQWNVLQLAFYFITVQRLQWAVAFKLDAIPNRKISIFGFPLANKGSIQTLILCTIKPITNPLSDSILKEKLFTPSSSILDPRTSRSHALSRLYSLQNCVFRSLLSFSHVVPVKVSRKVVFVPLQSPICKTQANCEMRII